MVDSGASSVGRCASIARARSAAASDGETLLCDGGSHPESCVVVIRLVPLHRFDGGALDETCEQVGARIRSLGRTTGGLAGGFEGAGATIGGEGERPCPWLWQAWPCGAAAGERAAAVSTGLRILVPQ